MIAAATTEIDPLFSKEPDEAREDVIEDAFSWGATTRNALLKAVQGTGTEETKSNEM